MEEDSKEGVMDQSGGEVEEFKIPANANETIYIKNLNEKVHLDGELLCFWGFNFAFTDIPFFLFSFSAEKVIRIAVLDIWDSTVSYSS
jgi:hypothetical protein